MKKITLFLCICTSALVAEGGFLSPYHVGRVTVRVIDEQGYPVTNATAGIGFSKNIPAGKGWGTRTFSINGQTDTNGMFSAEAESNPSGSCSARKEGYYPTLGIDFMFTNVVVDHWQPWNPILAIVLRKIDNPVLMYAKRVPIENEIPITDESVGYDLMLGDWVTPYGKGQVADFVFMMKRRVIDWKDFETHLLLIFSNPSDGIRSIQEAGPKGSAFRLPRMAFDSSYQTGWTNSIGYIPNKGYFQTQPNDCLGYFFRVRSVIDKNGNLVSALYGKIKGPIQFDARDSKTGHIAFTYYLNPTPNDRNVEFDPKRNLFKNLSSLEEVRDP
jgi:hypothetical protein